MNTWHQACHTARASGNPSPSRETYEGRIKYSTPDTVLTVIDDVMRLSIMRSYQKLTEALVAYSPYLRASQAAGPERTAISGLFAAALSAEELLKELLQDPWQQAGADSSTFSP